MDLVIDFSFQKGTQQRLCRVLPLSEGSICVLHVHRLLVAVAQVMRSCRQIPRLKLADVPRRKETV